MRLQQQIIILLLPSIVLPLMLLGWLAYDQLQSTIEEKTIHQINEVIQQVEMHLTSQVAVAKANVDLFANNELVTRYLLIEDEGERYELLQPSLLRLMSNFQQVYPNNYEIRLLLPDGYEDTRSTLALIPNVTESEGETAYFKQMQRAKEDIYTSFFFNSDNQEFALLVSKRIALQNRDIDPSLAESRLRAYLVATIDLDFLRQQQKQYSLGTGSQLLFTDDQGRLLFSPPAGEDHSRLSGSFFSLLKQRAAEQTLLPIEYQGKVSYVRSRQLADNLMVFALLPEQTLLAANRQLGLWVGVITLAAVLIASGLLFFRLRVIALKPLQTLNQATRHISQGNLAVKVAIPQKNELGDLASSFNTMSERLQHSARQIERLAYHDSLTGLPNRRFFLEQMRQALRHNNRQLRKVAILFLDLDDFKRVNDSLGHEIGDALLRESAERLMNCVRSGDFIARSESTSTYSNCSVARWGGDEFTILLPYIRSPGDAASVAQRILKALSQPFVFRGIEFYIGITIGIALSPDDASDIDRLINYADVAMYHAKQKGKNHYQFYSASMNTAAAERLSLENALRKAIENDELTLYYQPQVETSTQELVGVEALVRWSHPERGIMPPDQFIPLAEKSGLIVPLGEWVLRHACRQAKRWQDAGYKTIKIAVNISNYQLNHHRPLNEIVEQILLETGLAPSCLDIELTESMMMDVNSTAMQRLKVIQALGVQISMDDFGTGYSSLGALRNLPIDVLKIDRTFVQELTNDTNKNNATIVSLIIAMTRILKLKVIAEGVETTEQLNFLREKGCDMIQGHLISPPVPAEDIPFFFQQNRKHSQAKIYVLKPVG